MSTTNFMNLELPTVSVTLGPEWATELNAALEIVDAHDHSSGKGTKVTPAGFNINVDLDFNSFRAIDLKSSQYEDQASALSGLSNIRSLYSVLGDLYYTSGAGVAVQLTSGGSIVSAPGAVTSVQSDAISSDLIISASDNFVLLRIDTTVSRTITLPLASTVASGRIYIIQDATGSSESFPVTITVQGSDEIEGDTEVTLSSNYGTMWVTGDGIGTWALT